jgi:MFS family permease
MTPEPAVTHTPTPLTPHPAPGPGSESNRNPVGSPPLHDPYAALRQRNYQRFAGGFLVSSMGLQMFAAALGWEIYERTNDPLNLGLVGLFRALPVIALALPAGHIIDRCDKKRVLVLTQIAMGVLALLMALASWQHWPLWAIYGLVVLAGCARVFNGPARATLLPLIVPANAFGNATTWNSGAFQISGSLGPILAGFVLHSAPAALVYIATGVGCLCFGALACSLEPRASERHAGPLTLGSITAGLSHVWNEKSVLAAITLDLFAVLLGGATALFPVYARDILHTGEIGYGLLRASPFVGAAIMAFVMAHRPPFRHAGPALLWSVAGFGVCMIIFGLSTNLALSILVLLISGALDNISVVIRHVLVQVKTPESLRGRVSSVNSVFIESSNELGAYESGLVARYAGGLIAGMSGVVFSVVSGGVGTLVVVGLVAALIPPIRSLSLLHHPESEHDAERRAQPESWKSDQEARSTAGGGSR